MSLLKKCKLVLLRHEEAKPAEFDMPRQLTSNGEDKAIQFGKKYGNNYDFVITSIATRAFQTACFVVNDRMGFDHEIVQLPVLYVLPDKAETEKLEEVLEQCKCLSMRDVIVQKELQDRKLLEDIGFEGAKEMRGILLGDKPEIEEKKILVVGHALTLNSLLYSLFWDSQIAKDIALNTQLATGQGIEITTDENGEVVEARILS
jgi:phosphohistidine phosphatase SixA